MSPALRSQTPTPLSPQSFSLHALKSQACKLLRLSQPMECTAIGCRCSPPCLGGASREQRLCAQHFVARLTAGGTATPPPTETSSGGTTQCGARFTPQPLRAPLPLRRGPC